MISIIVAIYKNNGIGKNNTQPVYIKEDLKRFARLTKGHAIIMGRKTFDAIIAFRGKPLADKTSIVISRSASLDSSAAPQNDNVVWVHSIEEAIKEGKKVNPEEIFIIGGGQIFNEGIKFADRLYITEVDYDFEADVFFPDYSEFRKKIEESEWMVSEAGPRYRYVTLEK